MTNFNIYIGNFTSCAGAGKLDIANQEIGRY